MMACDCHQGGFYSEVLDRSLCENATEQFAARSSSRPRPRGSWLSAALFFQRLYITSLVIVRLALPADPKDPGIWLADPTYRAGSASH